MAVWKADVEGTREPEAQHTQELEALIDRLDADPDSAELRAAVGDLMWNVGCARYRGWSVDVRVADVRVVDRTRADAWWRGTPPKDAKQAALWLTKAAKKILNDEHPDHTDLPPKDVIDWEVSITARPA